MGKFTFEKVENYYWYFDQYLTQYRLEDLYGGYLLKELCIRIPDNRKYDREALKPKILTEFPMPQGTDQEFGINRQPPI